MHGAEQGHLLKFQLKRFVLSQVYSTVESANIAYHVCPRPSCNVLVAASLVEHEGGYYMRILKSLLDLPGTAPKDPEEVTLALAAQPTE